MSTEGVSSSQGSQSSSTGAVVAGSAAGKAGGLSEVTSSSSISSVAELRSKAPEIYQKMLEGIAMNICNKMKRNQEDLKKLRQEYQRNA